MTRRHRASCGAHRCLSTVTIGLGSALLILATVAGLGGCQARTTGHGTPTVTLGSLPADTTPALEPATSRAAQTSPTGAASTPAATTTAPRARTPLAAPGARLHINRVHVDAPIVAAVVRNGVLDVPLEPHTLGWWSGGAVPGSGKGSIVIDGHINYAGVTGALAVLPSLQLGDRIDLTRSGHTLTYAVQAVRTYDKHTGLPADAFSQSTGERLVLITCGGPFDPATGNYEDNIVAYATPA
jgi:hypothetical protein